MAKNMSGSKRLSHGSNPTYNSVGYSKNKNQQAFHERSDLRSYKEGDPGNSKRKHGNSKKGRRSSY